MIAESVRRVLSETRLDKEDNYPRLPCEKSRPGDIPPSDDDIHYIGDINPDVWNELSRGDYGDDSLNEDSYSYNGLDQQAQYAKMSQDLWNESQKEKNYKKNLALFKRAYKTVYRDYSIIGTLKRKSKEDAQLFSIENFLEYVKDTEKETLYEPIWKKYGGEYEELADQFLQHNVILIRRKLGMDI